MNNYGKALTWDELADIYPGKARICPMDRVFEWAENQPERFYVDPDEGTLHLIEEKSE